MKRFAIVGRYADYSRRAASLVREQGVMQLVRVVWRKLVRRGPGEPPATVVLDRGAGLAPVDDLCPRSQRARFREEELVVVASRPFRAWAGMSVEAQLAATALSAGHRVVFVAIGEGGVRDAGSTATLAEQGVVGLTEFGASDWSAADVFGHVSERARLVIFEPAPQARMLARYARARGVEVVAVLSTPWNTADAATAELVALASRLFATSEQARQAVERDLGVQAAALPPAAMHAVFDPYRTFPAPPDRGPRAESRVVVYQVGDAGHIDWGALGEFAGTSPLVAFSVLGSAPVIQGFPANVQLSGCLEPGEAAAHIAHCDALFLPLTEAGAEDSTTLSGAVAALFLGKPVVATRRLGIAGSAEVLLCADPSRLAAVVRDATARRTGTGDDAFVSRNSWLSRLESIAVPPARRDVSAIILIHNNVGIIGRCLETLLAHCGGYLAEVIVVDNASTDGGAEYVETHFPGVTVLRNPENGCSSGRNLGVQRSSGRYLAFFDSDQWFVGSSGFSEALRVLEAEASVGVIGWNAGWFDRQRSDLGGMISDYCPNRGMNAEAVRHGYRTDVGFLGTSGMFMRREVFLATDGFDPFYDPTCFEDTDICFQVKALGMKVAFRDLSGIRHQPHQTTGANSGSSTYRALFLRNADYFREKWKERPEFFVDYPG
jgi:GT2 family glycosyltransferase